VTAAPVVDVGVFERMAAEMRPPCEWRLLVKVEQPLCGVAASWIVFGRCRHCGAGEVSLICQGHMDEVLAGDAFFGCDRCGRVTRLVGAKAERL
jgi:hypothetical protein